MISRNKKRYSVTFDEEAAEKVIKLLRKAKISLSGYLNVLVVQFAKIVDETGISKKLDNLTMPEALMLMSQIMKGIEVEKKRSK